MLLHFDKFRRRIDDVIWMIMQSMLNDQCVNNNKFNYHFVNQSCFNKTCFSNKNDETRQRQRLNDHFFLNVFNVNSSFKFNVDSYFQNANLIKRLLYDVAYSNNCLHVKFSRIFCQMNEFIFDRRENDFETTRSRFVMSVHFFQNATIARDVKFVRQYFDIVHEIQRCDSTKKSFQ